MNMTETFEPEEMNGKDGFGGCCGAAEVEHGAEEDPGAARASGAPARPDAHPC